MKKNRELKLSGDRLSMFSDGVIAIIITLMILGIELPEFANDATTAEILDGLSGMLPALSAYTVSFFSLAIFWANHHNFFHMIKHIDRSLLWFNMVLLFVLSIIPLPTEFLAQHYDKPVGVVFYSFWMLICNAQFGLLFYYANKRGLIIDKFNVQRTKEIIRLIIIACTLWIVSIFTAFVSVYISFALIVIIALLFVFPQNVEVVEEDDE